jgi:hypothetical protein
MPSGVASSGCVDYDFRAYGQKIETVEKSGICPSPGSLAGRRRSGQRRWPVGLARKPDRAFFTLIVAICRQRSNLHGRMISPGFQRCHRRSNQSKPRGHPDNQMSAVMNAAQPRGPLLEAVAEALARS